MALCRLISLTRNLIGTANDVSWTFAYNPASQVGTQTRDNDAYAFPFAATSKAYAVNGLNQYTAVAGTTHSYDANGNLTGDGVNSYTYDVENRLVSATTAAQTVTLSYDPLGRLNAVTGTVSGTTRFLYDGDELIREYDGGGAVRNTFVHGAGVDDPLVDYGPGGRRFLHKDHQGSIVALSDNAGNAVAINKYDEYGVPAATNAGRFGYTGQIWIAELGLWYYKAWFYSPGLGRFLQVDPIGYDDQVNLYAYVANDPLNITDPTGLSCNQETMTDCRIDQPSQSQLIDAIAGGTKLQEANNNLQETVDTLQADPEKKVTLATVQETGSRIRQDITTTQGAMANALAQANITVLDSPYKDAKGVVDTKWKADNFGVLGGRDSLSIRLYPRAFEPGMDLRRTFIHEGAHMTPGGASLYWEYTSGGRNFKPHRQWFDRMECEVIRCSGQ